MMRAWNDNNETMLDEMAEQLVRDQVIRGASWGFISDQGIRFKYSGKQGAVVPYCDRDVEAGLYYDLASLTKVIGTTTRVLQLVEKGVISLSTPVKEILGRFSYGDVIQAGFLPRFGTKKAGAGKIFWNISIPHQGKGKPEKASCIRMWVLSFWEKSLRIWMKLLLRRPSGRIFLIPLG